MSSRLDTSETNEGQRSDPEDGLATDGHIFLCKTQKQSELQRQTLFRGQWVGFGEITI